MPDSQPQQQKNLSSATESAGEERKPAIRTMKSDVAEYLQKAKPSLAHIVGLEVKGASVTQRPGHQKTYFIAGGIIAALFIITGAAVFIWQSTATPAPEAIPAVPREPAPFFAVENSRTVVADTANRVPFLRLMEEAASERRRDGTITRIVLKLRDGPQERFATLDDFFALYRIEPPPNTFRQIEGAVMPFLYHTAGGTNLGLAVKTRDTARTFRDLLLWESSLAEDLRPLVAESSTEPADAFFGDRTYRNIGWRFVRLVRQKSPKDVSATTSEGFLPVEPRFETDLGIGHAVFPAGNIAVVTTSRETMETVIDRLFNNR